MSRLVALAAVLALTTPAAAEVFVGEVIATDAAWQGDDIITTAIVRTADGEVVVEQLGGHADGYHLSADLVDVRPARDVLGLEPGHFLHAGPPLTWERASGPMVSNRFASATASGSPT